MQYVRFTRGDATPRVGVLADGVVREIPHLAGEWDPLVGLLRDGPEALTKAAEAASMVGEDVADLSLLPPMSNPPKVIGIGMNYESHRLEIGAEPQSEPTVFGKFASAITGPNDPIVLPAAAPRRVDYEAELAVVLGATGRDVPEADAMSLVVGYMVANDVSARDWQVKKPAGQWELGKSFDTFLPLGPSLVTADEIDDPHGLRVTCEIGEDLLQDGNTGDLIFPIPALIAYLSRVCTLMPGDLVLTGTPGGVGMSRKPPRWLGGGDVVCTTVEGLGRLANPVQAASS
jgi:2-keto-4-pentenoate hydratase/2-oxohepta-3-ene-1,7-dioic acid hydratase in catechol pathway